MESEDNVMVVAKGLRKVFGSNVAVNALDFEIQKGETFGLLGPNGAGKTTTINLLVGLLRPDQGEVQIGISGDPLDPATRKRIGVAPQSLSLYDELTAGENLSFFGQLYGLAGKSLSHRVDWCLAFAGLEERRGDRVSTFSGGMRRRLNIAVALIHEPEVILLDEPTVGVDPQSRNHIFDCIEQLKGSGTTILYTTHYMEEAQRLCDRVAIVDDGCLLDLDTVDGLICKHGGRSVVQAELKPDENLNSFDVPLPGRLEDGMLRFESDRPLESVAEIAGQGVQFQTLKITRPDLESVFLSLTGRSLRD
jgi:ABC-2 type transport system ATP-binding protein